MQYDRHKSLRPRRLERFNLRTLGLVGIIFLPGCLSLPTQAKELDRWVGADQSVLVSRWGAPSATAELPDGGKVLTYTVRWNSADDGKPPEMTDCRRSFTISKAGKVVSWSKSNCPMMMTKDLRRP